MNTTFCMLLFVYVPEYDMGVNIIGECRRHFVILRDCVCPTIFDKGGDRSMGLEGVIPPPLENFWKNKSFIPPKLKILESPRDEDAMS